VLAFEFNKVHTQARSVGFDELTSVNSVANADARRRSPGWRSRQ
jgi:hypothetical protein